MKIGLHDRETKYKQKGTVLWFTGLSGAGKTTLSSALEKTLFEHDALVTLLDGDIVRQGLNQDLGFSLEDRKENIRRIGEVAKLLANNAFIVIVAFISPLRADRDRVRALVEPGRFVEVFVDCPLDICEQRDTKGLYKKARAGEISNFTGISSPYEPPLNPEIHLHTDLESAQEDVAAIMAYLEKSAIFEA